MILRITQKLAKKIKVVPPPALPPHDNPFLDWTAHLFMVSRWQCILLTNSRCLYSVVMAGKGVSNQKAFVAQCLKALCDYMALDGVASFFNTHITPATNSISFCKAGDRRILGSMNELIFQAKCYLLEMALPLEIVNMRLNETPMKVLDYQYPREALRALGTKQQTNP